MGVTKLAADVEKESQVENRLYAIANALEAQEKKLTYLEERLTPVLMPIGEAEGPVNLQEDGYVPLAARLHGVLAIIERNNDRLQSYISRMEL